MPHQSYHRPRCCCHNDKKTPTSHGGSWTHDPSLGAQSAAAAYLTTCQSSNHDDVGLCQACWEGLLKRLIWK